MYTAKTTSSSSTTSPATTTFLSKPNCAKSKDCHNNYHHYHHHARPDVHQQQPQQQQPHQQQALAHRNHHRACLGKDYTCGLWSIKPKWLQTFANKQAFLVTFCLTSVLQGMYQTYFVSVLTTIEKLYQIRSQTTGIILSATEIGQIGGALLLTYYGGRGNRPKWIAFGMLLFALASIFSASPHLLFGDDVRFDYIPPSAQTTNRTSVSLSHLQSKLCYPSTPLTTSGMLHLLDNRNSSYALRENQLTSMVNGDQSGTTRRHSSPSSSSSDCSNSDGLNVQSKITQTALFIFFTTRLLIGIGITAVNNLGIPYIDDNVARKESPLYFGITIGVRIFGPVLGFLLGFVCTSLYVDFPFGESQGLTPSDPQWVGAWWLGVLVVGFSVAFTSFIMMSFPRKLPGPGPPSSFSKQPQQLQLQHQQGQLPEREESHLPLEGILNCESKSVGNGQHANMSKEKLVNTIVKEEGPRLKDFPAALKRLLKNRILVLRTASSVLHILPIAGVFSFLPKYLESQFRLTAGEASVICAIAGIFVMGVGIFASGIVMRKYQPSARFVAKWIALSALVYSIAMISLMFIGCPLNTIVGLTHQSSNESTCARDCSCQEGDFSPICIDNSVTYISPCVAGCTQLSAINESIIFKDCKCLQPDIGVKNGACPSDCNTLKWYILILAVSGLIHSTSEVGSMLLTLRCVDPQDKALALGLISVAIGLFGNVPCPIIYGAVIDYACLFWGKVCGKPGACRIYDPSMFRLIFHGVTAFIMLVAFVFDALVWYKASSIKFNEEEPADQPVPEVVPLQTPETESCL